MKKILLIITMTFLSAAAQADQRITPDGHGGYIISSPNNDMGSILSLESSQEEQFAELQLKQANARLLQAQALKIQQENENQRLQNELLRKKLGQEQSTPQPSQNNNQFPPELRSWAAANSWYGSDKPRSEFALLYAKQLRQERPSLVGKPFYDAISAKITEVFGASK
jgi:regulator of replication initiation timing